MQRKWMISVVLLFVLAVSVGADNWGLGLRLGVGENSPTSLEELYNEAFSYGWTSKELTKGRGVFGLEALYEWDLTDENQKIGARIGIDGYSDTELKLNAGWMSATITENTVAFPLTIYYKRDNGIKKWSWMAGVGVTLIRSELELKTNYTGNETTSKSKAFPHLMAGAEYRFSKLFALGLEARCNISAKMKDDGDVVSDRSGLGVLLTGRFYF